MTMPKSVDLSHLRHKRILIMAGGTGGHIFPALAVADALEAQQAKVFWLGTEYGLETQLVSGKYPLLYLSARGVRKKGLMKKLVLPFSLLRSIWQAKRVIKKNKIDCVVGFGGYAAGPGGIAAKLMRVPLITHEQNVKAGMTNKSLAKFADCILCAFPTKSFKQMHKLEVVGNPVRSSICQMQVDSHDFYKHHLNVLVLGGSQGAKVLNDAVPQLFSQLPQAACVNIWHQTGEKGYEETKLNYEQLKNTSERHHVVTPFIEDMDKAYQWADIVVCRSGALTVSEISAAALPAFFVPFPYAVDDHQYHNAQFLVQAEAAVCIRQENFNIGKLAAFIRMMDLNRDKLKKMAMHAKGVAKVDATRKVLEHIVQYIKIKK